MDDIEQYMENGEVETSKEPKNEQFVADMVPIDVSNSRDIEAIFQIFEKYDFTNPSLSVEVTNKLSDVGLVIDAEGNPMDLDKVADEIESNYPVTIADFGERPGVVFVRLVYS